MQFMTIHRIPDLTAPVTLKSIAQYDRKYGKIPTSRFCRDELLKSVSKDITKARAQGANYSIVSGDFDQDTESNEIQTFMRKNGLFEVHREANDIEGDERKNTNNHGRNQIDVVFAT